MTRQLTTIRVIDRWLKAKATVQEQAQAARNAVIERQHDEMRGTYPEQARVAARDVVVADQLRRMRGTYPRVGVAA